MSETPSLDIKKTGRFLVIGGVALIGIAIAWWAAFYGSMEALQAETFPCVAITTQECGFIVGMSGLAGLFSAEGPGGGIPIYRPAVLWIGIAMLVAGMVLPKLSSSR